MKKTTPVRLSQRLRTLHEIQRRKRERYPRGLREYRIDTMRYRLGSTSPRPLSPTASSRYDIHLESHHGSN